MKIAAGILPFYENLYLLGLEHHGWSAFSGMCEIGETPFEGAFREFQEESCNVFKHIHIDQLVLHCKKCIFTRNANLEFYLYVCDFKDLIENDYITNISKLYSINFNQCNDIHYKEKSRLYWYTLNEIKNLNIRKSFESSFKMYIQDIQ